MIHILAPQKGAIKSESVRHHYYCNSCKLRVVDPLHIYLVAKNDAYFNTSKYALCISSTRCCFWYINMKKKMNSTRIKRFDEIDTDSDFELDIKPNTRELPSAGTSSVKDIHNALPSQQNSSESILLESVSEKAGNSSDDDNTERRKSPLLPTAASEPSPAMAASQGVSSTNLGLPEPSVNALDVSTGKMKRVENSISRMQEEVPRTTVGLIASECSQGTSNARDDGQIQSNLFASDQNKNNNDVLVRARQRLEEKRRTDIYSTPHNRPKQSSLSESPEPFLSRSPAVHPTASLPPQPAPSGATDGVMRRLAAENNRLHEEVAFLTRENNRYRSATKTFDSTDQMKLEITLEMLKKEFREKEESFLDIVHNLNAEKDGMNRQLQEAIEQSETYAAAASQYEKLYNDKIKDVQALSSKYQILRQEADILENKQRSIDKNYSDRLQIEIQKSEKYKDLLCDAKSQRASMQQLIIQLQQEVENFSRQCREQEELLVRANAEYSKLKDTTEDKIVSLRREIESLRDLASERQATHAAELREERRLYDALKHSLKRTTQESKEENEMLRKSVEAAREEGKQALREERSRRLEVESKLQRLEFASQKDAKNEGTSANVIEDLENRLRISREDFAEMRHQRDDALRKLDGLNEEIQSLTDSLLFYKEETRKLSIDAQRADELYQETDHQNKVLSSTIEELIHSDELQTAKIEELQQEVRALRGNSCSNLRSPADRKANGVEAQMLMSENERLTEECDRLTVERNNLVEENGRIAAELLNWKTEMRQFITSYSRTKP